LTGFELIFGGFRTYF